MELNAYDREIMDTVIDTLDHYEEEGEPVNNNMNSFELVEALDLLRRYFEHNLQPA